VNHQRPTNDAQVKLLLPSSWLEELDTIAGMKSVSRLAIIRQYLRDKIDLDLVKLDDHFQRLQQIKRGKRTADGWLQDRQGRDENNDW